MTLEEATIEAECLRRLGVIDSAKIERILPEAIDPIKDGDNGWDIQVTVKEKRIGVVR